MKQPTLELRRLSVNQRLSEETLCYSADVYRDGRLVARVANRGCGGCDEQHVVAGVTLAELNALCAAMGPPISMRDFGKPDIPADLETFCQRRAAQQSELRRLRRLCRRNVLIVGTKPGELRTISWKGVTALTPAHIAAVKQNPKYAGAVLVNEWSDAQLRAWLDQE